MELKAWELFTKWHDKNFEKNRDSYIAEVQGLLNNMDIGIIKTFRDYEKEKYIEESLTK